MLSQMVHFVSTQRQNGTLCLSRDKMMQFAPNSMQNAAYLLEDQSKTLQNSLKPRGKVLQIRSNLEAKCCNLLQSERKVLHDPVVLHDPLVHV